MKKTRLLLPMAIALFLIIPLTVSAFVAKTDESVYVGEEEIIEGNLYAVSNDITIDGVVKGDVICGAQTLNINGTVEGDVICGAQTINLNGEIGGDARVVGNTININGSIARNLNAFGVFIALNKDAVVGWEMFIAGQSVYIKGGVGGDLHGAASTLNISGEVGKDVRVRLDERQLKDDPINISSEAQIGGNIYYTAGSKGNISPEAKIGGEIGYSFTEKLEKKYYPFKVWGVLFSVFSALVVGLVLISLWRKPIVTLTDNMLSKPSSAIGWGVVVMLLTPIICILLMITLIGIPLSLIVIAVWIIALYVSKLLVGILIGRSIMEKLWKKEKESLIWAMIIGVVLAWLIASIPIIGWALCLVAMWWGLGGIWLYLKKA